MVFTKLQNNILPYCFLILIFTTTINVSINHLYTPGPLKDKTINYFFFFPARIIYKQISIILAEAGIIKTLLFFYYNRLYTLFKPLKSGEYDFTYGISPLQIIRN